MLDVGSGSGILSIAAARLGAGRVLALDVDPIAVDATTRQREAQRARAPRRGRAQGSSPSGEGPFDVVLANLIASVLIALADGLVADTATGRHAPRLRDLREPRGGGRARRSRPRGLEIAHRWAEGDWVALEVRRPG